MVFLSIHHLIFNFIYYIIFLLLLLLLLLFYSILFLFYLSLFFFFFSLSSLFLPSPTTPPTVSPSLPYPSSHDPTLFFVFCYYFFPFLHHFFSSITPHTPLHSQPTSTHNPNFFSLSLLPHGQLPIIFLFSSASSTLPLHHSLLLRKFGYNGERKHSHTLTLIQ